MSKRGKMACPDCLNEIEYAAERGGQAIQCPHCNAPVRLQVVVSRSRAPSARTMLERESETLDQPKSRFDESGPEVFQPAAFALFFGVVAALLCGGLFLTRAPWPGVLLGCGAIFSGLVGLMLAIFAIVNIRLNPGIYSGWGFAIPGALLSLAFGFLVPVRPAFESFVAVNTRTSHSSLLENFSKVAAAHFLYAGTAGPLPADLTDPAGRPLLSWRVALLPALGEQELFNRFHLDEPWDSPHNRKLVALMPARYRCSSQSLPSGFTSCQHATGPGLAFANGAEPVLFERFDKGDGRDQTIMLVQTTADAAVEWTRPADWHLDPEKPETGLASLEPEGFAGLADGQVVRLDAELPAQNLLAWFTVAGKDSIAPPEPKTSPSETREADPDSTPSDKKPQD